MASRKIILICTGIGLAIPAPGWGEMAWIDSLAGKYWYGVYMGSTKFGHASTELVKERDGNWRYDTESVLAVSGPGRTAQLMDFDTRVYDFASGELIANKYHSISDSDTVTVDGRIDGSFYAVTSRVSGRSPTMMFYRPVENLPDVLKVQTLAASGALKPGEKFQVQLFEPEPSSPRILGHVFNVLERRRIALGGIPTEVFVLTDSLAELGVKFEVAVDENGLVLTYELPGTNLVMKLEPEDLAVRADSALDVLSVGAIPCEGGPPNPRAVDSAVYIISGYDVARIPATESSRLTVFAPDSARLEVWCEADADRVRELPIDEASLSEFLKPEPLIQSDHEQIREKAAEIVREATTDYDVAVLINEWVYASVSKRFSPVLSNALQTLNSLKGDCGEHTALAVALLRAAGIPARQVTGLVYVPEVEGFAYHAWVEAYTGEWIQMDPTWGEIPVDATHIVLSCGDSWDQVAAIMNSIVSLRITIVSLKTR